MHISDCCQFSDIHISQGSVATYLRCGGIFKYEFVANLPMSLPVKKFWKSVNIWGSYGQEFSVLFFETQCITDSAIILTALRINNCYKFLNSVASSEYGILRVAWYRWRVTPTTGNARHRVLVQFDLGTRRRGYYWHSGLVRFTTHTLMFIILQSAAAKQ